MFFKIGHRGAMGYAPENTLASFQKALDLKVDMIEFDVHVCKSGELVVIHDDKVDRTTNGEGYVKNLTLKELQSLDAGSWEIIPTLENALDLINRKVKINIELIGEKIAEPVFKLIEEYVKNKNWQYDDFWISSFNHYQLEEFSALNPQIKIGALIEAIPIGYAEFTEGMNASSVNLSLAFIDQAFVDDAHRRGLKVFVWTVNELDDILRMKNLGVDGMFSNFPDRL
ncbi:MAG: glycerophosphodiester phosphodiesterase family protein [Candidatus Falkowbacteria bacterium]|nr:glycerophosphodiester phosphodiesterase family protein [Candidatus Falkowbacteria bacterium]